MKGTGYIQAHNQNAFEPGLRAPVLGQGLAGGWGTLDV